MCKDNPQAQRRGDKWRQFEIQTAPTFYASTSGIEAIDGLKSCSGGFHDGGIYVKAGRPPIPGFLPVRALPTSRLV